MYKVLIVEPDHLTNGGITKVVSYYKNPPFWIIEKVYWIVTNRSGNALLKLGALIKAFFQFLKYASKAEICHINFAGGNSA